MFIVAIRSVRPDRYFVGIYLFAQDNQDNVVGNWKATDLLTESATCGGLMHNSDLKKTNIEALWYASSNVIGDVTIKYEIYSSKSMANR